MAEDKDNQEEQKETEGEAEGEENPDEVSIGEEGEEGEEKPKNKKKRVIIIAVSIILLIMIPLGLYFSGIIPGFSYKSSAENQNESNSIKQVKIKWVYYDLDEMLVNLNTGGKYASFLKVKISLEVPEKNIDAIKTHLPKIQDSFIVYLREVREDDLKRSVGLYRLREELLLRVNEIVYPTKVNDVLFRDFIIQ